MRRLMVKSKSDEGCRLMTALLVLAHWFKLMPQAQHALHARDGVGLAPLPEMIKYVLAHHTTGQWTATSCP
ncbi:hypothetical protein OH76DRAFT_439401 [Lentinus brumalis]|uniref:Uncharacterized protein n=1 Tax=Lentinus brumalis TaxID=2498619 RepID=A0A371DE46_9APHY|nr:hypothetical protein OH76DRAFT_439401 [Polyporus brumalis]